MKFNWHGITAGTGLVWAGAAVFVAGFAGAHVGSITDLRLMFLGLAFFAGGHNL